MLAFPPVRVLVLDAGDRTPYLSRLVLRLQAMGVEMHYAGDPRWKDLDALRAAGVGAHPVQVRHKLDLPTRWRLRRLLKEHGIDVLHTITGRDAYVGIKARGLLPVKGLSRRGAYAPISRFDPADWVVYGRRGADRFVVVSEDLRRHMVGQGLAADRIEAVYTGIWSEELRPVPRDLRAECGVAPGTLLVAFVGNLRPVKGFDHFVEALALARARGVDVHAVVAGEGYEGEEAALVARGLRDRVTFLGLVPDIMSVTPHADALVLTSRIDALPRAAIEATVVGTPVIATRVGGLPEILDGGRGGVLTDPADPGSLAVALEEAARDRDALRALAAHARERNRALFSVDGCARRHVEIYNELR